MSEGMADIPEESNVDTESDGIGLGEYDNDHSDGDHDKDDFSDGDHDKDEDYVDPKLPESEDERSEPQAEVQEVPENARKRKKKQV